jgi:hypothetical protein
VPVPFFSVVLCVVALALMPAAALADPSFPDAVGLPATSVGPGNVTGDPFDGQLDPEWVPQHDQGTPLPPTSPVLPVAPVVPEIPLVTTPTVSGALAMMRTDGKAAIPRAAPKAVRAIIAAANQIIGRPYKWGGGHAKLDDRGYDCSGAVSYALIRSGLLAGPMVSGTFARWGDAGAGRWTAIYANAGHVYLEVAGLRLDTSAVGDPVGRGGVRWRPAIGRRRGFHARHVLGL